MNKLLIFPFVYFSNTIGSTNTLTNDVKEELTPIMVKKKSRSAPESDTSGSICDGTPVLKKKLSLDGSELKRDPSTHTVKEFLKETCQKMMEKDLDETSDCSSVCRAKMISPSATLTSVSENLNAKFQISLNCVYENLILGKLFTSNEFN